MPDSSGFGGDMGNSDTSSWGGMDGAPDVGTIGGNMSDAQGETSATMGGGLSSEQGGANAGVNADSWGYDFGAADMNAPGDWGLGQMFGYESPQGLPTNQGDFMGNQQTYGVSNFAQSPFGKTMRSILGMTPFGKVANMGIDAALGTPLGQIAANALPGPLGTLGRMGYAAANSSNPAASLGKSALGYGGGMMGSQIGSSLGGPMGGFLGGMIGSRAGGLAGQQGMGGGQQTAQGGMQGQQGGGGGMDLAGVLGGLGSLYAGNQNQQISNQMAQGQAGANQAIQGQMSNLSNMFSPNSPYAAQMRQQLARKDAAAGRNSQYGPREAQLQAALAGQQAQASSSMANLAGAQKYDQMRAGNTANTQNLQNMLRLANASGLTNKLQSGLSGLFGGGGGQAAPQEQFTQAPSYDMNTWGQNEPPTNWG